MMIDTKKILNEEFLTQEFTPLQGNADALGRYKELACGYARLENALAVLSDMRRNVSYIYYGGFARVLGIDDGLSDKMISSIWEDDIFSLIHPDDLAGKHLQELCFFHFVKRQPKSRRADYYLMSKLRMRTATGSYVPVLHRMYYVEFPHDGVLWLALCLYSRLICDFPSQCVIVNSITGQIIQPDKQNNSALLTTREKEVLVLIDRGLASKDIAEALCISRHTVSRHRQEILAKLQVKNSIEACRVAKDLRLI